MILVLTRLVSVHVELTQLFSLLVLSKPKIIRSLVQKPDNLLLEASLFQLLKKDLLVVLLDLVLEFADFELVFGVTSNEWGSFVELTLDFGGDTLLSRIEISKVLVQLFINLTGSILLGHVVRFI